jgi:outer membrane cobalamin receptor
MKRRIFCGAVLLCLAGVAAAQPGVDQRTGTVIGRVFDTGQGAPVEYANVVLYQLPESTQVNGTITDKAGAFRLDAVKPGRYYVEVSFIGYRDRTMKEVEVAAGAQLDLGRIDLEQKPVPVQGVEATAEKPAISYQVDKKVVDVSKLPNAASGTAVDALRDVPSVKVDIEDNVTLRGSANFKVLIDGRPTLLDANEVLKQTPAQTIDKIEIITNPSAKYEPDGAAGILNILLKKQKGRGTSALVNANAGMKSRYGGDALLSLKQGIANVYAGGNYRHYTYDWNTEGESRIFSAADTFVRTDSGDGGSTGLTGAGRAGLDLTFGPHDKSSVSGRFGSFGGHHTSGSVKVERHMPGDSSRKYWSGSIGDYSRRFFFVTADHEHLFDTTGHKLTASAYLVMNSGTNNSVTVQMDSAGADTTYGRRNDEPGPMNRASLDLGYTLPVRQKDKLEAGFQSRLEGADQDLRISTYDTTAGADTWAKDVRSSHKYGGTQDIQSLYATYTWSWRELGLQPGLRGEYGNRVVTVADSTRPWTMRRWDFFPSLHATYGLGSGRQVTASYSRRIDRPDPWYLRPVEVWYDEHWLSVGNPELRPSFTNSLEAGCELPFGANFMSGDVYYRTTSDMFEWVASRDTLDTLALRSTASNVGRDRSVGVEVTANVSPFKWFTAYLTGDVYHYREEATSLVDTPRTALTWSSSANLTFRPTTNTQVQLNGYYSGPSITATTTSDGWLGANLAVKQSLLKRALSVTLRLSNLLGSRIQHWNSDGPGFLTRSSYRTEGLTVSLALSYNFNNFKFDPKMRAGEGIEQEGSGGGGGAGGPQR